MLTGRSLRTGVGAVLATLLALPAVLDSRPAAAIPTATTGPFVSVGVPDVAVPLGRITLRLSTAGAPVIGYMDQDDSRWKTVACADAACSSATPLNLGTTFWGYVAMELDGADRPVFAFVEQGDVKVLRCGDPTCATRSTNTVQAGLVSGNIAMALLPSGAPVISYQTAAEHVRVAVCDDPECTSATNRTVDTADGAGYWPSVRVTATGLPVISYQTGTTRDLRLVLCNDATCTVPNRVDVDTAGDVGWFSSLALDDQDRPHVAYQQRDDLDLRLARCDNATCTNGPTIVTVDSAGDTGFDISLQLNGSGWPVIGYRDDSAKALRVAACYNARCGTDPAPARTTLTADRGSPEGVGRDEAMVLDTAGHPVFAHYDGDDLRLKLTRVPAETATIDLLAGADHSAPPALDPPADGPWATATLGWPTGLAADADGDVWFADRHSHTIRRYDEMTGTVTTVAGTLGTPCPDPTSGCGDGGPATSATLTSPWAVALDDSVPPNIWVSDYGAHKVRRIDGDTGVISTVAGTGVAGYDGEGTATARRLNYPSGLTVDGAGDVLVADRANNRIRRITPGGAISNFLSSGSIGWSGDFCSSSGSPSCDFDGPSDIEVKRDLSVPPVRSTTEFFIAERGGGSVWMAYVGPGGETVAERLGQGTDGVNDGPSATAAFYSPVDLDYDPQRLRLHVADGFFQRVRRFDLISGNVETVAGDGTGRGYSFDSYVAPTNGGVDPLSTALNFPIGLAHRPTATGTEPVVLYVSAVWENQLRAIASRPQLPCMASSAWHVMGC